jgi:hypothetical protein
MLPVVPRLRTEVYKSTNPLVIVKTEFTLHELASIRPVTQFTSTLPKVVVVVPET